MNSSLDNFISSVYPFFIKMDHTNKIIEIGKSLSKVLNDIKNNSFQDEFIIIKPTLTNYHFETLKDCENELIIVQHSLLPSLILRGQFKYESFENVIYLLCSPWILDSNKLKDLGLSYSDFAPSDPILDLISLSEKYDVTIEESLKLVNQVKAKKEQIAIVKAKNEKVLDSLAEIIFRTDNEGKWTYLNKAWEKTMGFTVDESIDNLFFKYLHPDDVEKNWNLFLPLINREKSYCTHNIRYITKDNTIKWIRVYATLIIDENNETQGTTGTLLDETKVIEKEHTLELILENMREEVSLVDVNENYVFVSPSFIQNRGYSNMEEFKSLNTKSNIHPEDFISIKDMVLRNETKFDSEYRVMMRDGQYNWYSGSSKIIEDKTTNIKYLLTISRNIEERIKSQKLLEIITENITDEITMFDLNGNYIYASPSVIKNRGFNNVEELKQTNAFSIIGKKEATTMLSKLMKFGEYSWERKFTKKNGENTWYDSFVKLINKDDNHQEYILTVSRNIEEKKQAKKHLELITNNISDEITMFDFSGQYLYATPSTIKNRGFESFEELKLIDAFSILTATEKVDIINQLRTVGECKLERQYKNRNSEVTWYESFSKMIRDDITGKEYIIAVARNIEQRKQTEHQLALALEKEKELNQLKTNFITTSSHEFKTPLAIIKNSVEILVRDSFLKLEEQTKLFHIKFLQRIDDETDRMLKLMNDTLILEKSGNNLLACHKEHIDILLPLLNTVERFNLFQPDNRTIQVNVIETPKLIFADKDLLSVVFENMISNAFKYSMNCQSPEIMVNFQKNKLVIEFKDYGIGIPETDFDKLFVPFNRASNTQGIAGSGMGLSIVKRIIDLHNGEIYVLSSQNNYTIFTIALPY